MDDRKKALELYAKQLSEGLPFAEDFIKGDADIENNSILARNLSEDALGHQVLKNTGLSVPNGNAPVGKKEDFLNRLVAEHYPEIKDPNIRLGRENSYSPSTGGILVQDTPDITEMAGKSLHESAHKYDNDILGFKGQNLDLKTLRDAKKNGFDLKNADPMQVYEMYAKGHHASIPDLREGTYGLGALKSMMKTGAFKAIAPLSVASQITPSLADLKEGKPNTAAARMVTGLAPAGTGDLDSKLMEEAQLRDSSPELFDPSYQNTLKNIGERRRNSGKSPVVESFSGQKVDTSATDDSDFLNKIKALQKSNSQG
jgi:hypothetical protein